MRKAIIHSIKSHLADAQLTNEQLAQEFSDWDAKKIWDKTGIATRFVATPDQCASDLGMIAAQKLFLSGACSATDIDFLIFCTQSPDYFLPTTACIMQERLGLSVNCGSFDINQGCSGYVYGLSLAKGLIETGSAENVLLITAETYTKFIHPMDRSARTLFSDGATATLVKATDAEQDLIGPFVFGTDGRGAKNLIVPTGGARKRRDSMTAIEYSDQSGNVRSEDNLYMNGAEIFNFCLQSVPEAVNRLLVKSALSMDAVDFFVFHQANKFMLETLRRKIKIPAEKFCLKMENFGNTVSSTIPMALEIAHADGQVKPGDRMMLVGFGVGYSWAAGMAQFVFSEVSHG